MENARLFFAIVLSFLVFFLWEFLFVERKSVQKPEEDLKEPIVTEEKTTKEPEHITEVEKKIAEATSMLKEDMSQPAKEPKTITIRTPYYTVRISEEGAAFKSFILKDYRETADKNSPDKELISEELPDGTIHMGFAANSLPSLKNAVFSSNLLGESVEVSEKAEEVAFSWVSPEGIFIEKRFHFSPETYVIGLNVTVKNGSDRIIKDNVVLSLLSIAPGESRAYGFVGPSALINNKVEQIKTKKIKDKKIHAGNIKWIAIEDRYFMSSIVSAGGVAGSMELFLDQNNVLENRLVMAGNEIGPGALQTTEFLLFLGPKSMRLLNKLGHDLNKVINFGWFDIIAKPCLWFMNLLHSGIPNYNIAIIILTIITKLILWPLGTKSYKSMNEMKKIQPLMTELREKYKDDKKKMNEELMKLYKVYKINPMGGCLPMLVQIPVFIALYRMLYEAIELRHAPFFLWITDLSAPDRLFRFGFSIPFMQPPYGIPVLTLIMGASMLLQQKMSPPPGDPAQAKMMMMMPIVFTFIFINFSSGLVLYWLVNNILSMAQQYYISKKTA
ncbi:MAG: membrane protein insertase YidC [Deltaproteobacteria bacterium]|nr:membrane protein insertase YidC [Deltaproteobacteria bacterium]